MSNLHELDLLENYLQGNNIPYERIDMEVSKGDFVDQHQIIVYADLEKQKRLWDAICQYGSRGYEEGLLEVMEVPIVCYDDGDIVCGFLTAREVIERFEEYKKEHELLRQRLSHPLLKSFKVF